MVGVDAAEDLRAGTINIIAHAKQAHNASEGRYADDFQRSSKHFHALIYRYCLVSKSRD